MKTKCPHCKTVQSPNSAVGDLDICDDCGRAYEQFKNIEQR